TFTLASGSALLQRVRRYVDLLRSIMHAYKVPMSGSSRASTPRAIELARGGWLAALLIVGLGGACSAGATPEGEPITTTVEALHGDIVDHGTAATQCFGMHCCPSGYGMRGLHAIQNDLLCRQVNQQHEDCFVDHPTFRQGVHACPRGTYMRGIRIDQNLLTCCYERERGYSELAAETVDGPTGAHQ